MTPHHLAQINVGRLRAPIDSPLIAPFVEALARINALAEGQPGFVWRLTGDGGDATDIRAYEDPLMAINMSVWTDLESLAAFVYRSDHRAVMRRRAEWFEKIDIYLGLWWIPIGHRPTPSEGLERLDLLRRRGSTREAFTFKTPFPPPDVAAPPDAILDECA